MSLTRTLNRGASSDNGLIHFQPGRRPRGGGGVPPSLSLKFGSLTPAGAGGWKSFTATTAQTVLTGTNANHFAMSATGVLTPTAAFVAAPQASYTLGATINGQPVTLNITIEANTYTVSSLAEANALDWTNMSGKTVAFRGPKFGGPAQYDIVQPGAAGCSVPWFNSKAWTSTVTCKGADVSDKPLWVVAAGGSGTRWAVYLIQVNKLRWTNLKIYGPWYDADEGLNMGSNTGAVVAQNGVRMPMIWLRNTVGDFEVDHCELYGNLSSFPMADIKYAWYGVLGYNSGSTIVGNLNIHDNVIHDCRRMLTIPDVTSGSVVISGNEFYNFGSDGITFTKANNTEVSWNYFHSPYTVDADTGHGDFIQSVYNGSEVLTNVRIFGNVMVAHRQDGIPAKAGFQGVFIDDIVAPGSYTGWKVYNNLLVNDIYHGVFFRIPKDCHVWRNTLVKDIAGYNAANSGTTGPWINFAEAGSNNIAAKNFCQNVTLAEATSYDRGNIVTPSLVVDYEANFVGNGGSWKPQSLASALAMFTPKEGGPAALNGVGALGSYFNWDNRTIDLNGAPWLDGTGPVLTGASGSSAASTSATLSVTTNEDIGYLYYYVSTSSTPPSTTDLKAGTGAVVSGSQKVTSAGTKTASVIGLTASTTYYAYFLHRDQMGNESAIAVASSFTTPGAMLSDAFVGSKSFAHNLTTTQTISLTDLKDKNGNNVAPAAGDIIVVNLCYVSGSDLTQSSLLCTGYTAAHTDTYGNDTRDTNQLVQYKVMGATPDTTIPIKAVSGSTVGIAVTIHCLRGINTTTPLDVAPVTIVGTNGSVADPAAITPVTAASVIMVCGASAGDPGNAGSMQQPSGTSTVGNTFQAIKETAATSYQARAATALYFDWSSGAYDPAVFNDTGTALSHSWSAVTLAFRRA